MPAPQVWNDCEAEHVPGCHGRSDIGLSSIESFRGTIRVGSSHVHIVQKRCHEFPRLFTEINDDAPDHDIIIVAMCQYGVLFARVARNTCPGCIAEESTDILTKMVESGVFKPRDAFVSLNILVPTESIPLPPGTTVGSSRDHNREVDHLRRKYAKNVYDAYGQRNHRWDTRVFLYNPTQREKPESSRRAEVKLDRSNNIWVTDLLSQFETKAL